MAIFDTMRHIRPDVSTVCVGLAARYKLIVIHVYNAVIFQSHNGTSDNNSFAAMSSFSIIDLNFKT